MTKSSIWEKVLAAAANTQLCWRRDNHTLDFDQIWIFLLLQSGYLWVFLLLVSFSIFLEDASFMNFVSNMPSSNPPADTKKERLGRSRRRRRRRRSWRRCRWRRRLPARRWWSPAGGRRWAGEGRSRQMQGGPEGPGNIYDLFTILNMSNIDKFWDVDINCDNLSPLNGRYPNLFVSSLQIQKYKYRNTSTEMQIQKHRRLTSNEKGSEEQTRLCQSFLLLHFFSIFSFFSFFSSKPHRPMDSSALITTCNRLGD